ncbi:MAG: ATP-binding cassette domain-containing protein [Pseudomonadota bacterium]
MIHATQITKRTGDYQLFSDVSFFLPAGSYTSLSGASGSGKTMLLDMIAGKRKPDSGSLIVNGVNMLEAAADRLPFLRREIGLVGSSPALLENRSVVDNVRMPLQIAGFNKRATRERAAQTLEELGLTVIADLPLPRLNIDQRWLVACAIAIVHHPKLVLFDQPAGVGDAVRKRIVDVALRLSGQGTTVLSVADTAEACHSMSTIELKQGRSFLHEHNKAIHQKL